MFLIIVMLFLNGEAVQDVCIHRKAEFCDILPNLVVYLKSLTGEHGHFFLFDTCLLYCRVKW